MKSIYKYISGTFLVCFLLTSCNDFLDKPPFDTMSDPLYWKNESHVRIFANGFYATLFVGYGTSSSSFGPFLLGQTLNDDVAIDGQANFAPVIIPSADTGWSFENVRRSNVMLNRVEGMGGLISDEGINHWSGVSRFFRAATYSNLSFIYGDVPYFDRVPEYNALSPTKEQMDYLYKDRDSRAFVAEKNIEDFRFAIENVRATDGDLQINKYVVAAYASRVMLREGTFLKYHDIDQAVATKCIEFAKEAALVVMSGPYQVASNYNALFSSDDLASNTEVILYRKYLEGIRTHATLTYSYNDAQQGTTKSLMESYLKNDGLPVYLNNPAWKPKTSDDFFRDRDPRMAASFRSKYYVRGENNSPFNYSNSGYSWSKFMDDSQAGSAEQKFMRDKNVTDAPCLRLGEVLLNYAEACYELGTLSQEDLNISINRIRARGGIGMPALQILGGQPAVNGLVYDDPKRDIDVPAMLWEIRRERRIELCLEGVRLNDLKRWKKMDYMHNGTNPDIRYGAYIRFADYPKINKDEVKLDVANAIEGYILCNKGTVREASRPRNYVNPIPITQIQLYAESGYVLSQTKEWKNQ